VLVSVLVRVTTRDAVPFVATVYYATPPLVGAGLLLPAGTSWLLLGRRTLALLIFLAVLLLVAWQVELSVFRNEPAPGQLRVLFWNVKGGARGWHRVARDVAARNADLVLLVEANRRAERLLPEYRWRRPGRTLAIGVRGTIGDSEIVSLGAGGRAAVARVTVRERPLMVVVVDIASNPLQHRREAFARLAFDAWRPELRHAFEAAGLGADWTWPMPLPILAIDHVWIGPALVPRAARHDGTPASDHRAVVVELAWASPLE
jgi:vancomycin resistance protein VanJ